MLAQGLSGVPDGTLCCDECWRLGHVSPIGAAGMRSGDYGWLCKLCMQLLEPFTAHIGKDSSDPNWHLHCSGEWNRYWLELHTDWAVEQRMRRLALGLQ